MTSFAESLNNNIMPGIPSQWKAQATWDGSSGTVTTGLIEPTDTFDTILEQFGYDPELVEVDGTVNQWRKQQPDGSWLVSYFFKVKTRTVNIDLPALYAQVDRVSKVQKRVRTLSEFGDVVVIADAQIGKVASRGGTPELLQRLHDKRVLLRERWDKNCPKHIFLPDVGDLIENFESGGNPLRTNDLSLTQQLDVAATEIFEFVKLAHEYAPVTVATVPSNHGAWRNGRQQLGNPGDDFGLYVHRQVQKQAELLGWDVEWQYPATEFDETVLVNFLGTHIGLAHGHQYAPGRAIDWWAKQQHGGQPVGVADILLTGHYHHLVIMPTGFNAFTGRSKYWLQAPQLDNGSDWYRNKAGSDSDPGLLVFSVGKDGFDLQSLSVL